MIPEEALRVAEDAYRETLTYLRLNEHGPFKSGSHHRRALHAALEASTPFIAAQALENAADAVDEDLYEEHDPFYVGWLKARAENIRENGTDQTECDDCIAHRTTPPDGCPIAYDHTDDLDECAVCGWGASVDKAPAGGPKDMANMTGPQRIQEAIDRMSGRYAPTRPILFRCGDTGDE